MIACVDAHYRGDKAVAACVLFREWQDEKAAAEIVRKIGPVPAYQPGRFYLRELPCLVTVLQAVRETVEAVVVDGYVWLGAEHEPGLGARLYDSFEGRISVIGVAKSRYAGASLAAALFRGRSLQPLFVTAVGIDVQEAAAHIQAMHGEHRIPTLLKRVDLLARRGFPIDVPGQAP